MAGPRKPGEAPRGPLAEGAARLDRIARIVKDNQLALTKVKARPPVTETYVLNPEEAWARKYMTHCISPECFEPPTELLALAKYAVPPPKSAENRGFSPVAPSPQDQAAAAPASSGPIGLAIGKGLSKRTWLGQFLGR